MKKFNEYINEKLKINSKSKIYNKYPEDWNMQKAEDGDFIVWVPGPLYFIYKGLNKDFHVNNAGDNAVVFHALYNQELDKLYIGPDTGIGDMTSKRSIFQLASEKECEILLKGLDKHGYKWDETKLEVIKKH